MKVVILAGGMGTRLSEETDIRPKPLVEIGGKPILWHIMKIYSTQGYNEFIILLGYKGYSIKEYFLNYYIHQSDLTIDLENNTTTVLSNKSENWKLTFIDTGLKNMTGSRLKQIQEYIGNTTFMMTYGDGVSNINISELVKSHQESKKYATLTAVKPNGRFGALDIDLSGAVENFEEKPSENTSWINAGFFVLEPEIFDYIDVDEQCIWEKYPLENLAKDGQLNAFKHNGFWKPMDMLRDKIELNDLWNIGNAPWKIW
jgi:glucose-1-phosphate cytidylyltransferase